MIKELLIEKRSLLINRWIRSIIESYPQETSKFLSSVKDRFSNPLGYAISESAEKIYDEITGGNDFGKIKAALEDIIKIRAVQDLPPSKATGFILSLKRFILEELEIEFENAGSFREFLDMEFIIDKTALVAFDLYMESKEKLFQIRIDEIKSMMLYNNRKGSN